MGLTSLLIFSLLLLFNWTLAPSIKIYLSLFSLSVLPPSPVSLFVKFSSPLPFSLPPHLLSILCPPYGSQFSQKILTISPSQGIYICFYLDSPCCLASLGSWTIGSLSVALQLVSTYEWVHTMLIFLGLGYLTQDGFLLVPSICMQISRCPCFLLLSYIPLCKWTTFPLYIHRLRGI